MTRISFAERMREEGLVVPGRWREVTHHWLPRWLARAGLPVEAITVGRCICLADVSREALLQHELVHVAQWKRLGVAFAWRYLREYFALRLAGHGHRAAYRGISFELQARRIAGC